MKKTLLLAAFYSTLAFGAAPVWEGDSGGVHVKVLSDDVVASMPGVADLSFRALLQAQVDKSMQELAGEADEAIKRGGGDETYSYSITLTPLSLANGVLGVFGESGGFTGGAHPFANAYFRAVDLASALKGSRKDPTEENLAKLTDFFGEADVFKALSSDKFLKKTLSKKKFKSLDDLLDTQPTDTCAYYVSKDSLKHFVFHSVSGKTAGVRIGFTHGCEVARGSITRVGLTLPLKEKVDVVFLKGSKVQVGWEKTLAELKKK